MQMMNQNSKLNEALRVGNECEDMARDIKVNLGGQSETMKNKIMRNLRGIQGELTLSNRFMINIKKERMKNKILFYGVIVVLLAVACYILFGWLL
jgi:hypothetical protein